MQKLYIIYAILMLGILCSCGEQTSQDATETETTTPVTVAETETRELTAAEIRAATHDTLPDDLDFDGATFTALTRDAEPYSYEMGVTEANGEVVNDALYARNVAVEERLNVVIDVQPISSDGVSEIGKLVRAGDDVYNVGLGYAWNVPGLAMNGYLVNLLDVPYINFDEPWWVSNLREELTLYDHLYFMAGDLTLSMTQLECVLFYNQKLWQDYDFSDNLYELVMDGRWTIDKLASYCKSVSADLNGDGKYDTSDLYGLSVADSVNIMAFGYGCGVKITEMDSDGIPYLTYNCQHTYDVSEIVDDMVRVNVGTATRFAGELSVGKDEEDAKENSRLMFKEDQILFYSGQLYDMDAFRDMVNDYGVLPFPKYDESQESYISNARDTFSMMYIPTTCQRLELTGAVVEAMAAESYRTVIPAYFNVALKEKYARDEETANMIDLVNDSIQFNFGLVHSATMNEISHTFQHVIEENKPFASLYARGEKSFIKGLEKILTKYAEVD